jgi:hypothetical protein
MEWGRMRWIIAIGKYHCVEVSEVWYVCVSLLAHVFPFPPSEYSNNGIYGIEHGIEIYLLVDIEPAAYDINDKPYPPLLSEFSCEHPHAYNAQGRGEGISPWYIGVGENRQRPSYQKP